MALHYGYNITASDMKSLLEKNDKLQSGVRTWRQLFGNASLGFNAQSDALTTDYSEAIAQAYKTNFEQRNAIMGAGLNIGATQDLISASRNDLHAAYESYIRNYGSDMYTLATSYNEEKSAIESDLMARAQNFADLYNSAYKYLSDELYGSYRAGEEGLTYYMQDQGLDWLIGKYTDENGIESDMLKNWDQIAMEFENPDGTLNEKGVQFFDAIFNAQPQNYFVSPDKLQDDETSRYVRTFDQWLSDTNPELREWYVTQDGYNYNFAGTNKGTANIISGRESTDNSYELYKHTDKSLEEFTSLDTAGNDAIEAAKAYEKADEERKKKSTSPGSAYATAERHAKEEAEKSWSNYYKTVSEGVTKLDNKFKTQVGSNVYNEFVKNSKVYNELNELIKKSSTYEYANEDTIKKIDELYRKLLEEMKSYFVKYEYKTGRTSGF